MVTALCLDTGKLERMNTLGSLAQVPCESCGGIPRRSANG